MFKNTAEMINAMVVEGRVFEYIDEDYGYNYVCKFDPECLKGKDPYSPFVCIPKVSNTAESEDWIPMNRTWVKYATMRELFSDLPDLEVDAKVLVREQKGTPWRKAHFKRFAEDRRMVCYRDGLTSYTANKFEEPWNYWKVAEGAYEGSSHI